MEYYPTYHDKYLIGQAKYACANPNTILIDDHDKNIDAFIENGGHGILVPARFNNLRGQDPLKVIKKELAKFM